MLRTLFIAMVGLTALSGCRPGDLYAVTPAGPPEYRLGWEDGCDTGLSAQGSPIMKMTFGFKKRPEMGSNELYKQAWNEGFTYCRFTAGASPSGDNPLNW
ncbi:MAG: hypothetical protein CMM93_04030 [Rickettsiales bacterium]|nr:hypothetical protein [Rickettsiales bacterium]|tara:strand:+ start:2433 stop:2732 length:300 start_codon:yes stop_codon:yes gene_type:complete